MNTIKHVLLKGNESFLDHTKSIALYGKLYWRKSNKKLNVGDIVYLFMSGKVLGKDGRNAFNLENALSLDKCQEFSLYKTKKYGSDVLLHYLSGGN